MALARGLYRLSPLELSPLQSPIHFPILLIGVQEVSTDSDDEEFDDDTGYATESESVATSLSLERDPSLPPLPQTIGIVQSHRSVKKSSGGKARNIHKWGLSVAPQAAAYVDAVVYGLHPTFRQRERRAAEAPFAIQCTGWGTFDVDVRVTLKPEFGGHVVEGVHELTFQGQGEAVARTELPWPAMQGL